MTFGTRNLHVATNSGFNATGQGFFGGVIEIAASGDTMLAGVLRADGFTPGGGHYSGGSGGSIYLRANRFRAIGGAVVSANGSGGGGSGGCGGGGRVAFWRRRDLTVDYTLAPTANYGVGGAAGTVGSVIMDWIPDPSTVIFLR